MYRHEAGKDAVMRRRAEAAVEPRQWTAVPRNRRRRGAVMAGRTETAVEPRQRRLVAVDHLGVNLVMPCRHEAPVEGRLSPPMIGRKVAGNGDTMTIAIIDRIFVAIDVKSRAKQGIEERRCNFAVDRKAEFALDGFDGRNGFRTVQAVDRQRLAAGDQCALDDPNAGLVFSSEPADLDAVQK